MTVSTQTDTLRRDSFNCEYEVYIYPVQSLSRTLNVTSLPLEWKRFMNACVSETKETPGIGFHKFQIMTPIGAVRFHLELCSAMNRITNREWSWNLILPLALMRLFIEISWKVDQKVLRIIEMVEWKTLCRKKNTV